MSSSAFYQMKDVACYVSGTSNEMIADLGCPNSVIAMKDENNFVSNLSKYQRANLEVVQVDEKFKFGPSGPFQCKEKLRFPICVENRLKWVEVALVNADIPMLLGNNLFKPLEAEIKLFKSGNGKIKLGNVNIDIKETKGGHYTLKVQDLGKLCNKENVASFFAKKSSSCEKCAETCQTTDSIKNHNASNHAEQAACDKCEYTCHNMDNLLAHTLSEHGEGSLNWVRF